MISPRHLAFQIDSVTWAKSLGFEAKPWQAQFLRAPVGASIAVLTSRQCGKTTTAAWALAHTALFRPGSLSVIASPTQPQSAEGLRKVKVILAQAGCKLKADNVYRIELDNGSRVMALPGDDDNIRGLTVDGWIIVDEAARVTEELIAALRPMRAQRPHARLAMLSTANTLSDPFWQVWSAEDYDWTRIKATAEVESYAPGFLDNERRNLGEAAYQREYLGIPSGGQASPFTWELYQAAITARRPTAQPDGVARGQGRDFDPDDPSTWGSFRPLIIAHDVGRTRDRSTAVVGGLCPHMGFAPDGLLGFSEYHELPQGRFGHARAEALAAIDRQWNYDGLVFADLSFDPSYAEVLAERFGPRAFGLQIGRHGDGMNYEVRPLNNNRGIIVYKIGRNYLFELLHTQLVHEHVRFADGPEARKAYQQLAGLIVELHDTGTVYSCPPNQHDDLAISCAIVNWASHHPHLPSWYNHAFEDRIAAMNRRERVQITPASWT